MSISTDINVSPNITNMLPITVLKENSERSGVREATVGDPDIKDLGILFRDHYKGMFRVAYRITGSDSDAEDVLQTVFTRLDLVGENEISHRTRGHSSTGQLSMRPSILLGIASALTPFRWMSWTLSRHHNW